MMQNYYQMTFLKRTECDRCTRKLIMISTRDYLDFASIDNLATPYYPKLDRAFNLKDRVSQTH
ncbi:MAG: hypothetical protein RLZZ74_2785 [Cyanobacteriota bacterium]|jgi:hypothetical protein